MVRQCGSNSHNNLPPFPYGLFVGALKVVFSEHLCMPNAAYISFISLNSISGFRQLIVFPVLGQFCCVCQAEESSTIFSGNVAEIMLFFCVVLIFEVVLIFYVILLFGVV